VEPPRQAPQAQNMPIHVFKDIEKTFFEEREEIHNAIEREKLLDRAGRSTQNRVIAKYYDIYKSEMRKFESAVREKKQSQKKEIRTDEYLTSKGHYIESIKHSQEFEQRFQIR
jgi:hypothetical protein